MNVAAVFAPKKAYEFLGYETFTCVHNANKAHDGYGRADCCGRLANLVEKRTRRSGLEFMQFGTRAYLARLNAVSNVMSRLSDWLIVGVAQFIRRERSDLSHLIPSELVRQRTGFNAEGDRFTAFIDSVCAEVSNRP